MQCRVQDNPRVCVPVRMPNFQQFFQLLQCSLLPCCHPCHSFRSGSSCSSTSLPVGTASRTYRSWTQQQMERAVTAVLNEGSSILRAALECGVPKSSLGDRISGRVLVDATFNIPVSEGRGELVTFLSRCACIGYAKSRKEVLVLVQCVLDRRGLKKLVTVTRTSPFGQLSLSHWPEPEPRIRKCFHAILTFWNRLCKIMI